MDGNRGRKLGRRIVAALSGLALLAMPAFSLALRDLWPALGRPVADQRLAAIRGGFTTAGGAQFSFGIERTVTINGDVVAITRLVLDNLQNLMLGQTPTVQFVTTLGTVVQNGPGNSAPGAATVVGSTLTGAVANTVTTGTGAPPASAAAAQPAATVPAPAVASSSPQPTATAPATAAATVPATTATTVPTTAAAQTTAVQPATPAGATAAAAAQPLVVQITVNGQVVQIPNGAALAALTVQNTLNNTQINTRTQIDAAAASLSALQSGQFAAALRQQILDSVRR
jgi:hypothetical protein